ncbi:MAG: beta-lactamase family protein, partial [Gemmatimonadota bacterium]|nr:beta-lactamase family protein [Gemmatimonadota bacterium]
VPPAFMNAHRRTVLAFILFAGPAACFVGAAPVPRIIPVITWAAPSPEARLLADTLARVLRRAAADSAFPGAFAVAGRRTGVLAYASVGRIDWDSAAPAPDDRTLWDLASLTKVIGMTSAMMQLVERGRVELDAPAQRYLPEWAGPGRAEVTVRHLLTHTSGLPAFRRYDTLTTNADSIAGLLFAEPLDTVPGARMVYSDIGAYLLGRIVERVSGQALDRYLEEHVFRPLDMRETMYRPPPELLARIAPTEIDTVRGKIHGAVHDPRAFYLGGVSAHAGLFGSARDLARFAQMYLNGGELGGVRIFRPETVELFTTRQVADRALGWQKPSGTNTAGHLMSERAFGHTGFTGTSVWMDPTHDVFVILLSNRVNPTSVHPRISGVRVALADAVMSVVTGARSPLTQERP